MRAVRAVRAAEGDEGGEGAPSVLISAGAFSTSSLDSLSPSPVKARTSLINLTARGDGQEGHRGGHMGQTMRRVGRDGVR